MRLPCVLENMQKYCLNSTPEFGRRLFSLPSSDPDSGTHGTPLQLPRLVSRQRLPARASTAVRHARRTHRRGRARAAAAARRAHSAPADRGRVRDRRQAVCAALLSAARRADWARVVELAQVC